VRLRFSRPPYEKDILDELKEERRRREAVLVLRGTGLNFWHYFSFLRNFSLDELAQFRAIYAMSGAAFLLWLYCLMEQGTITDSVAADYDAVMRRSLNRLGLARRTARLLTGRYPYAAEDFVNVIRGLIPAAACSQTLGQLPLRRMSIVAQEESRKELLVLGSENFPSFSMEELISRAVTWAEMCGRPFCERTPYHGMLIGDFDFAGREVREQFRDHLRTQHPGAPIYQINLFQNVKRAPDRYVRVCYDRFPRMWQLIDFASFYLGIPNRRYRDTALASDAYLSQKV
jgi:hypothetical protein